MEWSESESESESKSMCTCYCILDMAKHLGGKTFVVFAVFCATANVL